MVHAPIAGRPGVLIPVVERGQDARTRRRRGHPSMPGVLYFPMNAIQIRPLNSSVRSCYTCWCEYKNLTL